MKLGLAKSSLGLCAWQRGFQRGSRVMMLKVPLCAWATVGLQWCPGVVSTAPLPALRRGLLAPHSVWAVEPSSSGRTRPAIGPQAFPGRPFPFARLLVRSIHQPFKAS